LDHLNKFVERNYNNKYNVQTILEPLKSNDIDACNLLNGFVSYLQNDTINGHDLLKV
jgi:hypothetical protein